MVPTSTKVTTGIYFKRGKQQFRECKAKQTHDTALLTGMFMNMDDCRLVLQKFRNLESSSQNKISSIKALLNAVKDSVLGKILGETQSMGAFKNYADKIRIDGNTLKEKFTLSKLFENSFVTIGNAYDITVNDFGQAVCLLSILFDGFPGWLDKIKGLNLSEATDLSYISKLNEAVERDIIVIYIEANGRGGNTTFNSKQYYTRSFSTNLFSNPAKAPFFVLAYKYADRPIKYIPFIPFVPKGTDQQATAAAEQEVAPTPEERAAANAELLNRAMPKNQRQRRSAQAAAQVEEAAAQVEEAAAQVEEAAPPPSIRRSPRRRS